jgi:hypothetical protein
MGIDSKGIQGYLEWGYIGKGIQGYLERGNIGKGIHGIWNGYIWREKSIECCRHWTLFSVQDSECRLRDMDWTKG